MAHRVRDLAAKPDIKDPHKGGKRELTVDSWLSRRACVRALTRELTHLQMRLERWLSNSEHLLLLQRTCVQFPLPTYMVVQGYLEPHFQGIQCRQACHVCIYVYMCV